MRQAEAAPQFVPPSAQVRPRVTVVVEGETDYVHVELMARFFFAHEVVVVDGHHRSSDLLAHAVRLHDAKKALDDAQERWSAADLTRQLLSSSMEETGLPSITMPGIGSTAAWEANPLFFLALEALEEAAKTIQLLWLFAVSLLTERLGSRQYEFDAHPPHHESSPLGILGLGSPLRPRAPGGPADLPVPSHMCALAA
ncbi:hypothetical protein [Streptomyces scabiei]|uniref:hypothetical protein n=1 Tax=Streptomyces scabiei TaxID=1930 RepID=UPI0029A971D8|nr:hypothetical protein [Streptomyces scabiei]MDX3205154.1 hypothetical protein [Streptomyces scabiei]